MLILTPQTGENKYEFVYLSDELVNIPIKSLLLSQNQKYYAKLQNINKIEMIDPIFKETALCNKQGELL
jgi:hypothetical protein